MQIALWSNQRSNMGVTTLASVLATLIAAKYNYKTLLTHTMTENLSMENYLLKATERGISPFIEESSVDGLFRLINNGKLSSDLIPDYCFSLLSHSNLDFLNASKIYQVSDSFRNNYMYLVYLAKQFYDVTIIDLDVGMEDPLFDKVMAETDVFLVIGQQNKYALQQLIDKVNQNKENLKGFSLKTFLVLNKYALDSNFSQKQFFKEFKIKKPYLIPYQVSLIDACNRHELVDFLLRQLHNKRANNFHAYLKAVGDLVDEMMKEFQEVQEDAI